MSIWHQDRSSSYDSNDYFGTVEDAFVASMEESVRACFIEIVSDQIESKIIERLESLLSVDRSIATARGRAAIIGMLGDDSLYVQLDGVEHIHSPNDCGTDILGRSYRPYNLRIRGTGKAPQAFASLVKNAFEEISLAKIIWWYQGRHGIESRAFFLPQSKQTGLFPELYPDIGDPEQLIADYLSSDAAVMLLAGPAGTGKTSLLRHMVCSRKLVTHVVYDEALMNGDGVFQGFLFGEGHVMIIEDADTILADRSTEHNKLMSRFLNVSDGLLRLPNKKLVFTTNLSDFGRIDPALTRPGRCFGVVKTRELNLEEAQAAARVANLPIPMERREYTLAQLFNMGSREHSVRMAGFRS